MSGLLGERLLLTLWVGSLWAIGYIAVPTAFIHIEDATLAGNYAGQLFSIVNILGIGCGSVLLLTKIVACGQAVTTLWRFWVMIVMLALTLILSSYIQPEMSAIKQLSWQQDTVLLEQFSFLHAMGKNLYIVISLLGLALVLSTDKLPSTLETKSNGQK
ncbi:MAG: hypothetical protein COB23_02925 [Methylophaga sp.]|nr:MAG: hypothetical protein COB23_02925 [Methylophaga sp.]